MFPAVFVSHGMPAIVVQPGATRDFFRGLGKKLGQPQAIVCVSAHWEAVRPMLTAVEAPETIHDFSGPPILFEKRYATPGEPALAREAARLLTQDGIDAGTDPSRGLDHGAWVPLILMYPEANVPVVQLSVQTELDPQHHVDVGKALRPLREEGILVLGSGGATHNLPEVRQYKFDSPPPDYALAFDTWLEEAVTRGRETALINYQKEGPSAALNHPYPAEHFLPLFVPLGAAAGARGQTLHKAFHYGVLSMAAYVWE